MTAKCFTKYRSNIQDLVKVNAISKKGLSLIYTFEPILPWLNKTGNIDEAYQLRRKNIEKTELILNKYLNVNLTQGQYDALTSIVFNTVFKAFQESKSYFYINKKNFTGAENLLFNANSCDFPIKNKYLIIRRREAEHKLWCTK
jgi:GH24 family phage-related lysozyme (muramidase)